MFCKGSLLLLTSAVLLMVRPLDCRFVYNDADEDLLIDNLVGEDLKDEGLDEPAVTVRDSIERQDKDGCSPASRRNTDEYIDRVLEEVRPKMPDPAFLPDRVGRVRLFNGTLSNLVSMKRIGPALVRCTDNTFSFLVPVGLQNLTGKYFWETDAGVPVFRGLIDLMIGRVDADVLYTRIRNPEDGEPKARVDRLTITRLQDVKVNMTGLGPLNAVASRLTNLAVRFFHRGVARALEGPVRSVINKELANVEKYEMYY